MARNSTTALVAAAPSGRFTPAQVTLIKNTIARGATDDELAVFLYGCEHLGLDPLLKQAYWVKRRMEVDGEWKMVGTLQISIDGMRAAAQRTGAYDGETPTEWCGPDGVWRDVWLSDEPPAAARVGVRRRGWSDVAWAVARYGSYVQRKRDGNPNRMWTERPDFMLGKCASAAAHRRAFPDAFSGVYTNDELAAGPYIDMEPEPEPAGTSLADRARAAAEALAPVAPPPPDEAPEEAPPEPPAPEEAPADNGPTLGELRAQLERHGATAADLRRWIAEAVGDKPSARWTDTDRAAVRRRLAEALAGGDAV